MWKPEVLLQLQHMERNHQQLNNAQKSTFLTPPPKKSQEHPSLKEHPSLLRRAEMKNSWSSSASSAHPQNVCLLAPKIQDIESETFQSTAKLQLQIRIHKAHSRRGPGTCHRAARVTVPSACPWPAPQNTTWNTRNQSSKATIKNLHPNYLFAAVRLLQDPSPFFIYSVKIFPCIHNLRE